VQLFDACVDVLLRQRCGAFYPFGILRAVFRQPGVTRRRERGSEAGIV